MNRHTVFPPAGAESAAMSRSERGRQHFVSRTSSRSERERASFMSRRASRSERERRELFVPRSARSESPMGETLRVYPDAKMDALLDSVLPEVAKYYEPDRDDTSTANIGEWGGEGIAQRDVDDEREEHSVETFEYTPIPIVSKVVFQHGPYTPHSLFRFTQEIELLRLNDAVHHDIVVTHSVRCETKASGIGSEDAMNSPHRRQHPSARTSEMSADEEMSPKQKDIATAEAVSVALEQATSPMVSFSADTASGTKHHDDAQAEPPRCFLWSLFLWFLSLCAPRLAPVIFLFVLDG